MDAAVPTLRTFEQMLAEGAGGLTGAQCTALVNLLVGHPPTEVGSTAAEWGRRLGLPREAVETALQELTAPRRREYAARRHAESVGADPGVATCNDR
jgi:hypothetical protein